MNTKYIVLAEDDIYYTRLLVKHVHEAGFEIATATNGEQAIEIAIQRIPDIFLVDLLMPVIDGFETIRRINSDNRFNASKVLAISNLNQDEDIQKAIQMGAVDFISKNNTTFDEVINRIKSYMSLKEDN